MTSLWVRLQSLWKDERGAQLAEYGIIAVLIAVVSITVVSAIGQATAQHYNSVTPAFGP